MHPVPLTFRRRYCFVQRSWLGIIFVWGSVLFALVAGTIHKCGRETSLPGKASIHVDKSLLYTQPRYRKAKVQKSSKKAAKV